MWGLNLHPPNPCSDEGRRQGRGALVLTRHQAGWQHSLENVSSPAITKSECFLLGFQNKDTDNEGNLENVGSVSFEITQMSAEAHF